MSMVARLSTIELIQKQTDERILGMAWQAWLVKQGVQGGIRVAGKAWAHNERRVSPGPVRLLISRYNS